MSRVNNGTSEGSWNRRKALFNISNLTSSHDTTNSKDNSAKMLKKHRKRPSLLTDLSNGSTPSEIQSAPPLSETSKHQRPSFGTRVQSKRPPSVFTSLRGSIRSNTEKEDLNREPLSAASTNAPSLTSGDIVSDVPTPGRALLLHGEVQTSAGMFRKKKEYLVLTENYITRYKSQAKAAEAFSSIPNFSRSSTIKHSHMPSYGSSGDLQTVSDSSGDKSGRIPLYQVVAVHTIDDGKPYFTIEVSYLDEDSGQASSITMQFSNPQERDNWLENIRQAVNEARFKVQPISTFNLENAARIIERDNDYDPDNCVIYKIVQNQLKPSGRSSSDDLGKIASNVGFLAIGVHKIHLIPLARPLSRGSSPSLASSSSSAAGEATVSYGILTISSLRVSETDDSFDLTIRKPLSRSQTLHLASSAAYEIAARLYLVENLLRPESGHRFYKFVAPPIVNEMLPPSVSSDVEDHNCFHRTLIAYCVAYGVSPTNICYAIDYNCEDAPRFNLLPATDERRPDYNPIELLAIMRALRYNESFSSISFSGIPLNALNGLHDNYGREYVCTRTKNGTMIKLSQEELAASCLLKQEIRALAVTNRKLRRLDFSNCITIKPKTPSVAIDEDNQRDPGCAIVEALLPLCRHQTTNVDWLCLNGIVLSDTDLDYLVGAAVDKACHFRALELNRCGLTDRTLGLILDALRAQENTLEAIELAGNTARIESSTFDSQLSVFGFIRKLDLSFISRTSGPEPLLHAETLMIWRLSELRLTGTTLNEASVDALGAYLSHQHSSSLHELFIDSTQLSGADIATLLHCLARYQPEPRDLYLDISGNNICKDLDQLTHAISAGHTPRLLSMRAIEYREESQFRKMLAALAVNKSTTHLNISHTALPGDASSESCRALGKLISHNDTLVELNISGEDSRLASSRFGSGINEALACLRFNKTLRSLHVERQRLGMQGASTLSQALRENNSLQELYCDHNEIPLQGLTDLVNALIDNTSLFYMPKMDDGRAAAFRTAEQTMRYMKLEVPPARRPSSPRTALPLVAHSPVKRGLASVRRSAQRTASAYTPSFPALQSYSRAVSNPLPPVPITPSRSRQSSESPAPASPVAFTAQDIQTTHRLLNEQWDRQCFRLAKYLDRNWCLLNGMDVAMEVEDEKFERPDSAGSLSRMLEQVKYDTTPRAEKEVYFDASERKLSTDKTPEKLASFKHFLLESGPTSPESEGEGYEKQLKLPEAASADGRTPTQATFPR